MTTLAELLYRLFQEVGTVGKVGLMARMTAALEDGGMRGLRPKDSGLLELAVTTQAKADLLFLQ